jgi:hypothetical protein
MFLLLFEASDDVCDGLTWSLVGGLEAIGTIRGLIR